MRGPAYFLSRTDCGPQGVWPRRELLAVAVLAMIAGGLAGCGEVEWKWDWFNTPKKRPAPVPIQSPPARHAPSSQPGQEGSAQKGGARSGPDANGETREVGGFYQLLVLSEPGPGAAPPGIQHVRLSKARARDVGEVLSWLYVPSGPAGTVDRYTLVYPARLEWEAAANVVSRLDVAAVGNEIAAAAAGKSFALGVGIIYGTPVGHPAEGERLRQAEASLQRVYNGLDEPAWERWAAGMMAGSVAADRLYDYDRAEQHFLAAESVLQPGVLERMCTMYARARAHIQNGKPQIAQKLLADIIAQFPAFRGTETFERARKTLAELDRGK